MSIASFPIPQTFDRAVVSQVANESTLSTSVSRSLTIPRPLRWALRAWLFPKALRLITTSLSGERLGQLSVDQAKELYGPLSQFHSELRSEIAKWREKPPLERYIAAPWIGRVSADAERLSDILESLAWSADDDLRSYLDSSVADIERRLEQVR